MAFSAVNHWESVAKTMLNTEFWLTFVVFGLGAALAGTMVWLEKRPRQDLKPRLFPTTPFLLIGGAIALFAAVHLLNLAGLHTGGRTGVGP
jgi:amino acid transporter